MHSHREKKRLEKQGRGSSNFKPPYFSTAGIAMLKFAEEDIRKRDAELPTSTVDSICQSYAFFETFSRGSKSKYFSWPSIEWTLNGMQSMLVNK